MKIIYTIFLLLLFQTFTVNGKDKISNYNLDEYFLNYNDEFANYRLIDNNEFFLKKNPNIRRNVILLQAYTNLSDYDPLKKLHPNLETILVNLHPMSKKIFNIQYEFSSDKCQNFNEILKKYFIEDVNLNKIIITETPSLLNKNKKTFKVFYSHKFEDEFNYTDKGKYFEAACVYGEKTFVPSKMDTIIIGYNNNLLSTKDAKDFRDYDELIKYPTSFGIKLLSSIEDYLHLDFSDTEDYLEEGVVSIFLDETKKPSSFFETYKAYFNPLTKQILQIEGIKSYSTITALTSSENKTIQECDETIKKIEKLFYDKYKAELVHKAVLLGQSKLYFNSKWNVEFFNNCSTDGNYSILYSVMDKDLLKAREVEIEKLQANSF